MAYGKTGRRSAILAASLFVLSAAGSNGAATRIPAAADTTIGFDDRAPGTVLTNQYADAGGPGRGVVFGPLPGSAGDSARPVITSAAGQAQSGSQVASINCPTCNEGLGYIPHTTGTFAVPRTHVSVYVGLLGSAASPCAAGSTAGACAVVSLLAFDVNGKQIAASTDATVTQGAGVHTLLSVSTASPQIVGFEIAARDPTDNLKNVAIDDLTFDSAGKPAPDFTLTPASTSLVVTNGQSISDQISIGRIAGSTGPIRLDIGALPAGVHAQFAPNPADSSTTLTLSGDSNMRSAPAATVKVTGTPLSAGAGAGPHSFDLNLLAESVCDHVIDGHALVAALVARCNPIDVADDAHDPGRPGIDLTLVADHPDQYPGYEQLVSDYGGVVYVPPGVTIESDRSPTHHGALIYMSHQVVKPGTTDPKAMLELDAGTRVTGLRLKGWGNDEQHAPYGIGIDIIKPDVLIDDNEISFWSNTGVGVGVDAGDYGDRHDDDESWIASQARRIRITDNFIHDNVDCAIGYGIGIGDDSYALIERNVFNYDKHDIADNGKPHTGYIANSNFTLSESFKTCRGNYEGHFDVHGTEGGEHIGGTAGTFVDIRDNAFRGDQRYHFLGRDRRPAFDLRGTPTDRAIFVDNVTEAPKSAAVAVSGALKLLLVRHGRLVIRGNRYEVNTSRELAAGDFNGDGRADVFVANGTGWFWSASGRREWRYLNSSSLRLNRLGFGDFNGDGKTDVFSQQSGDRWLVSYGGTTPWTPLPAGSNIPMSTYRFGDFDGDGKTDVFRANGSRFYYSSGGATPWKPLATSSLKVGGLRFCDFNGDGKTDVFSLANKQWSVSYGGNTSWQRLNSKLSSNLGELAFADFDGDGRCDVARAYGRSWQVSSGGTSPWRSKDVRYHTSFSGTLLDNFAGGKGADILQFVSGDSARKRFALSRNFGPFDGKWSEQDML